MSSSMWTAVGIYFVPWFWRLQLVLEHSEVIGRADLRGFASDALAASFWLLLMRLTARRRVAIAAWLGLWSVLNVGGYEHVRALAGALPNLGDAHFLADPTFLFGSALHLSHPWMFIGLTLTLLALPWLDRVAPASRIAPLLVAAAALVLLAMWPADPLQMPWRQHHPLVYLVGDTLRLDDGVEVERAFAAGVTVREDERLAVAEALAPDLGGTPIVNLGGVQRPNVLLILLEGLSGSQVPTLRTAAGLSPGGLLELGGLAERGLLWSHFVTQQRQTQRGVYALLAGEPPKLLRATPRATEIAASGRPPRPLLPARLAQHGYATLYLQTAPLDFMLKDRFMPLAGFASVERVAITRSSYASNAWGVDDRSFFEAALTRLEALDTEAQPWFATLLNTGTHHPYAIPKDFPRLEGESEAARAARYSDGALGDFVRGLGQQGLLDRTLVLITTDESPGILAPEDRPVHRAAALQWGFLIALTPERDQGRSRGVFAQSDLALSVVDYLRLEDAETMGFGGRSVFRTYPANRPVFFGNVYEETIGVVDDGEIHIWSRDEQSLLRAAMGSGALLDLEPLPADDSRGGLLAEAARRSLAPSSPEQESQILAREQRLAGPKLLSRLVSGQYIHADRDLILETEIDVEVFAPPGQRVRVKHHLAYNEEVSRIVESRWLGDGDRHRIRTAFRTGGAMPSINFDETALRETGEEARLVYHTARMRLVPTAEWREDRLRSEEFRILEGVGLD